MTEALAVLALLAGVFAGFSAAKRLKQRETALFQTQQFLLALKLSLEYAGKPLAVLLAELQAEDRFCDYCFLHVLAAEYERGEALPCAWKTAAMRMQQVLGGEGAALLLRLGSLLGATDKPGQTELLSHELARLESLCHSAKETREHCASLYRAAGVFTGFAVFILVI